MTRPLKKFKDCDDVEDCKDALDEYKIAISKANWDVQSLTERINKHAQEQKDGFIKVFTYFEKINQNLALMTKEHHEERLKDIHTHTEAQNKIWKAIDKNYYQLNLRMAFIIFSLGGAGFFAFDKISGLIYKLFT